MKEDTKSLLRKLPSVDKVLLKPEIESLCERWRRELVVAAVNSEIDELRELVKSGALDGAGLEQAAVELDGRVSGRIERMTSSTFRRVINATGIVVHTNLGRSPLPQASLDRIGELAGRYLNLEFDLDTGKRGSRDEGVRRLLRLLFPDFEAVVVNNNAAAVLLALNTLAEGREAVISRGRIIEIGDGFRINQIQEKSGARLVEVGTTNRTHLKDFEEAVGEDSALLFSVHPSNYRVVGFTADVSLRELVALGSKQSLPVVEDWGSGCLVDPQSLGIAGEESAEMILAAGPDAICFSGDKLMGGPQAGIIVGKPDVVERMRRNHLYRALRVDKMTLLALEEVLLAYLRGETDSIPTVEMLGRGIGELRERAEKLVKSAGGKRMRVVESSARVGGGAAPEIEIPSIAIEIDPAPISPDEFKDRLRAFDPPVIARVRDDKVYLDLRTVFPDEDDILAEALKQVM